MDFCLLFIFITKELLQSSGLSEFWSSQLGLLINLLLIFLACFLTNQLIRFTTRRVLIKAIRGLHLQLGDYLVNYKIYRVISYCLITTIVLTYTIEPLFSDYPRIIPYALRSLHVFMAFVIIIIINRSFNAFQAYLETLPTYKDKPLDSFFQLSKIIIYITGGITAFAFLIDKSPIYIFGLLGGASVVLIFAFKDPILGFVASIQLSYNDMLHIGDWVTVEAYYADGEVIEINLTTIKIQNFDKTITTIPTYALISGSFKNWQGMLESDGRRIKRSILINLNSVRFCSPAMLKRFEKIELITTYIQSLSEEIYHYNKNQDITTRTDINGRKMTNLGCFRVYIENYLKSHSMINHEMTCMVRQLTATEKGLPIELYAFSKIKEWGKYERIVADIFDHIYASVKYFDLQPVQIMTGKDIGKLV